MSVKELRLSSNSRSAFPLCSAATTMIPAPQFTMSRFSVAPIMMPAPQFAMSRFLATLTLILAPQHRIAAVFSSSNADSCPAVHNVTVFNHSNAILAPQFTMSPFSVAPTLIPAPQTFIACTMSIPATFLTLSLFSAEPTFIGGAAAHCRSKVDSGDRQVNCFDTDLFLGWHLL
ncbi:unnamed protein product [Nesidiocoris tenuis]|uniref:Uncharacterized protein n=1 Tax=Nesidiocoris tenuis TaxID=355587 RepID=A0A6H5HP71_9HEMI|nr:unnamed protein product [Nesidiocoris tenuis]